VFRQALSPISPYSSGLRREDLGGGRPTGGGDGWRTIRDPTAVEATGLGQSRGAPAGGERGSRWHRGRRQPCRSPRSVLLLKQHKVIGDIFERDRDD
jgi:hypothetical protein